MTGIELIAAEHERQISIGWTSEHDDTHAESDLAFAACYYAMPCPIRVDRVMVTPSDLYPDTWESNGAKRSADRIRNLVKAGALIAAEIDRLQRRAVAAEYWKEAMHESVADDLEQTKSMSRDEYFKFCHGDFDEALRREDAARDSEEGRAVADESEVKG